MEPARAHICQRTSERLRSAAGQLAERRAMIGFDGFVDEILAVVDKRYSLESFEPIHTLAQLGARISAAAGQSSNLELIARCVKLGGNGPIMANALANLGVRVRYVGALGEPVHPVFRELAAKTDAITIGEPGHTDALEFADGKLMLGKYASVAEITWARLLERVGLERLRALFDESDLVGLLNWTMFPAMSAIWKELIAAGFFARRRPGQRLFIDLCDPDKRTPHDLLEALELMRSFQQQVDVVLGLNPREAEAVAAALGESGPPVMDLPGAELLALRLRERLALAMIVIHPRAGAVVATAEASARFAGPFTPSPKISTGGGDHFNAGFSAGLLLGMPLEDCLCLGVATSGIYIRTAESPTPGALVEFIRDLPAPEPNRGRD